MFLPSHVAITRSACGRKSSRAAGKSSKQLKIRANSFACGLQRNEAYTYGDGEGSQASENRGNVRNWQRIRSAST